MIARHRINDTVEMLKSMVFMDEGLGEFPIETQSGQSTKVCFYPDELEAAKLVMNALTEMLNQ